MDIDRIIVNNDLNYIIGFIVIVYAAVKLQDNLDSKDHPTELNKSKMTLNFFFLAAVTIIAYHNLVLGVILSILFLSTNV